ncbi:MAG TPA: hypothetical protein DCE41_21160 [Cytophagales bacterium]|nr:hypothetical protein [Cytophagales bacterium]HAA19019.1 hypothetical protein [Cytophagales bacterium]HAP63197.1 hypothetical protein [Cytophagales bacterium]
MKTILFCNSLVAIPTMVELVNLNQLQGIVIPSAPNPELHQIKQTATERNIPLLEIDKEGLSGTLTQWLGEQDFEVLLAVTFPYKIPSEVTQLASKGAFNVHFSLLPKYRGNDPVFWQLKNGERVTGVTIHSMADEIDQGDIVLKESLGIFPGENYGLLSARLGVFAGHLVKDKLISLVDSGNVQLKPQGDDGEWLGRPTPEDCTINWQKMEAEEIENLINACNMKYGGAISLFRGAPVRILEVNPADVNNAAMLGPGTIVYADGQYGIFVSTKDMKYLSINILQTPEAVLTGRKLGALGVKIGEKFT